MGGWEEKKGSKAEWWRGRGERGKVILKRKRRKKMKERKHEKWGEGEYRKKGKDKQMKGKKRRYGGRKRVDGKTGVLTHLLASH